MIIAAEIHDAARFTAYTDVVFKLVIQFGGRYRVLGGTKTTLEGDWGDTKLVISEWPSREVALAFWHSPEYAQTKPLRIGAAQVNVMLADTVSDQQWTQIVSTVMGP